MPSKGSSTEKRRTPKRPTKADKKLRAGPEVKEEAPGSWPQPNKNKD